MEEVAEWRMVYVSTMIYIIQYDSWLNQKSGSHLVGYVILPWRVLGGSSHLVIKVVRITPIYKPWKGNLEGVPQPDP